MANKILPVAEALKQVYTALGGNDDEVLDMSTNTELIQEIAGVATGGGGLPEVSDADEGKVLTVDSSGEWAAKMPSCGGNPLIIFNFSGFASGGTNWEFAIAELDNGTYLAKPLMTFENDSLYGISVYAPDGEYACCLPLSVPTLDGWALLFRKPDVNSYTTTVSGNISQTTVTLNFGSIDDAYIITGDCIINITAI